MRPRITLHFICPAESLRTNLNKLKALTGVPSKLWAQAFKHFPEAEKQQVRSWLHSSIVCFARSLAAHPPMGLFPDDAS